MNETLKKFIEKGYAYDKIILTDYGTIIVENKEYPFEYLEEILMKYHSHIHDFSEFSAGYWFGMHLVDKNDFLLDIYERKIIIRPSKSQKSIDEDSVLNKNIQKLREIVKIVQSDKEKQQISSRAQKTGELPSSNEEIKLYIEYLEEELAKRKAEIANSCRKLTIPFIWAPITYYGIKTSVQNENYMNSRLFLIIGLSSIVLLAKNCLVDNQIENIKEAMEDFVILYYKLLILKERIKELALEEMETTASLPEAPKVKVYGR